MPTPAEQQAMNLIQRSSQILIVTPPLPSIDALCSAGVLTLLLAHESRSCDYVVPEWREEKRPSFFPSSLEIRTQPSGWYPLHIRVPVAKIPLRELTYHIDDGVLDIMLTPANSAWSSEEVHVSSGEPRYDLVIACGIPDQESFQRMVSFPDGYARIPVLAIDHHSAHTSWGELNLLDLTCASITEVLFHWLGHTQLTWRTPEVTTLLLAGLLANTRGFQSSHLHARSLDAASVLMRLGAKRQDIVNALWRTRTVSTLHLWGRILSRLTHERDVGLLWASLTHQDLTECSSTIHDLPGIVEDLILHTPEARLVVILLQTDQHVNLTIFATPPIHAVEIGRLFDLSGTSSHAQGTLPSMSTIVEAVSTVIPKIVTHMRTTLPNR